MTTFEKLVKSIDKVEQELLKDDVPKSLLSSQLSSIKSDLKLMLWIELPELNDAEKYEALYKNNDFKFHEGFLERTATRKAFWRRLAKATFNEDQNKREFTKLAEKTFKEATLSWQEFLWGEGQLDGRQYVQSCGSESGEL